jgi:lysophospholipase L1-like esterase
MTAVKCTATDSLNRTASCEFPITVSKLPQLSKVRYLAFGDSITAGEVTFPVGSSSIGAMAITKQVVVPSAAYPTLLAKTLQGRYASQADAITVANYGLGGERVINARNRYLSALTTVRPEVVLILEGLNDIPAGENGAASGAAAEIRVWVAEARLRGMSVFIATPTPGRPGGNRTVNPVLLVDWANRIRDIAARDGATLVELYNTMLPDVQRYIGVDGLHPNEQGYAKIRRHLLPVDPGQFRSAVAFGCRGHSRTPQPRLRRARRRARRVAIGQRRRDRHAARAKRRRQDDNDEDLGGVDPADCRPHFDRWHRAHHCDRRPCARQRRTPDRGARIVGTPVGPHQPPDLCALARPA